MVQDPFVSFSSSNSSLALFRFVSFFDLYDLFVNRRLRLSKLSTFSDKNEGIGHILQFQEHKYLRVAHIDKVRIASTHESVLENHYVSCWTKEADLISMWSLYSPDCMAIRISTTVEKLLSVFDRKEEELSWVNYIDKPGNRDLVSLLRILQPVQYVDFFELRDKIREKYQALDRHIAAAMQQNKNYLKSPDGYKKDCSEFHEKKIVDREGLFLKDRAYIHENEVRAILYCGVRNNLTVEEMKSKGKSMDDMFEWAKKGELQDYIYANVDPDFVQSVCFDPRMPTYKRRVFESALEKFLPQICESKAFGYALQQDSFASDLDGYPS